MTGLIYVAIIAVWAVVLVPAWLRRHDHLDPERSVDRFTRSMQTLATRPSVLGIPMPTHEERAAASDPAAEVVRPRRGLRRKSKSKKSQVKKSQSANAQASSARRSARFAEKGRGRRRLSAAARRRIVLALLVVALLVVIGLVVAQVLLPVAIAAPSVLIVGFLFLARHQVRAARRARSRAAQAGAPRAAATSPAAHPAPAASGAVGSTWEARSAPLPTYVTAPRADGYPRSVDQVPGAWTAAAMLERAQRQKDHAERMAAAKAEAVARARAEQEAAQTPTRDEQFLAAQAVSSIHDTVPLRRVRAVNE